MEIRVDIDGTLCDYMDWDDAGEPVLESVFPRADVVDRVNELFDEGETIVIWTARVEGERAATEQQLRSFGVHYDRLEMGKPVFDLMIDDRARHPKDWLCGTAYGRPW